MEAHTDPEPIAEPDVRLTPCEVRARALGLHAVALASIGCVARIAARIEETSPGWDWDAGAGTSENEEEGGGEPAADRPDVAALRTAIAELVARRERQIAFEMRHVGALLALLPGWGRLYVEELQQGHACQRECLRRLDEVGGGGESLPARELAMELRRSLDVLQRSMEATRRVLLRPDLLRDDPVCPDQEDG